MAVRRSGVGARGSSVSIKGRFHRVGDRGTPQGGRRTIIVQSCPVHPLTELTHAGLFCRRHAMLCFRNPQDASAPLFHLEAAVPRPHGRQLRRGDLTRLRVQVRLAGQIHRRELTLRYFPVHQIGLALQVLQRGKISVREISAVTLAVPENTSSIPNTNSRTFSVQPSIVSPLPRALPTA